MTDSSSSEATLGHTKADGNRDEEQRIRTPPSPPEHDEKPFGEYPDVPFDIDQDIRRSVLGSCIRRIEGDYYEGRAHGADLIIDRDTAYFNASNLVRDNRLLNELMDSETMRLQFDYVQNELKRRPYYIVVGRDNRQINGVYMHGISIGNVIAVAASRNT